MSKKLMKTKRKVNMITALLVIAIIFIPQAPAYALPGNPENAVQGQQSLSEQMRELERYLRVISENFKSEVDLNTLIDGAFKGATNALGDPYSIFYGNTAIPEPENRVIGEYVGIGVQLETITWGSGAGDTMIIEVLEGSPAESAGIQPGDIIIAIDENDVRQKLSLEITSLLRGQAGTEVSVTVSRGRLGEHTYVIVRGRIEITTSFFEMIEENVGYINIASFGAQVQREFATAKNELIEAGAEALIIDIRDNPGGVMGAAVRLVEELLDEGVLFHIKERGEIVDTITAAGEQAIDVPIILLVNERTASASEMFAAALKYHDMAILVGTRTFGKGTVQIRRDAGTGQNFTLSIYSFLTPGMETIEGIGITPHYEVRNVLGERREVAAAAYGMFAPFIEETRPVYGEAGLNVLAAQQRLRLLGYDVTPTAVMDYATVTAISEFQSAAGLWAGGVLDFTTQRSIREATLAYINNTSKEDLQLLRAIELAQEQIQ